MKSQEERFKRRIFEIWKKMKIKKDLQISIRESAVVIALIGNKDVPIIDMKTALDLLSEDEGKRQEAEGHVRACLETPKH